VPKASHNYLKSNSVGPNLLDQDFGLNVLADIASCRDADLGARLQQILCEISRRLGADEAQLFRLTESHSSILISSWTCGEVAETGPEGTPDAVQMASLVCDLQDLPPGRLHELALRNQPRAIGHFLGAWLGAASDGLAVVFLMRPDMAFPDWDATIPFPVLTSLLSCLRRLSAVENVTNSSAARSIPDRSDQWRVAVDMAEDAVAVYDGSDQLIASNNLYQRLGGLNFREKSFGRTEDMVFGDGVLEYTLPDGRFMKMVRRKLPEGGCIETHKDITPMRVAEQRLRNLIDGARICTWEWNVKTGEHSVNEYWATLLGYELAELHPVTFDTWRTRVHPDDLVATEAVFEKAVSDDKFVYLAEYRLRHKSGRWIWVLDSGRTLHRGPDGTPELIAGVQVDISEQKAREAALTAIKAELERSISEREKVEQRLVDIASVSDGWLWEMDSNRRYSLVLDGEYFDDGGVPKEGLIGLTQEEWLEAHPDMYAGIDWASLLERLNSNQPFRDFIYRAPRSLDGVTRWRRMTGTPIFDSAGTFMGYRGVGSDVTELYLAKARAEEASRTKSMFVANMSHEIRTPLNGVLGMAEVLDNALSDPEHKRMIGTIRKSGETLLNILNDVLDISKIEAGKLELENVPFRLQDLAERVEELHGLRAEEKGIELDVLVGAGSDMQFVGDPYRIQQILHNLVSNAVKFTEQGEVEVKIAGRSGTQLLIEVRDTGIGMTEEQLTRLHDEYSQADVSVTRRFGGTGLGMAITRTLVEKMGGTIDVASEVGEGTTIQVWLPLASKVDQPESAPPQADLPDSLAGVRILAADDNSTNRAVLEAMLSRRRAEVVLVSDGQEAVNAYSTGAFDVVLLDIAMPVMDGMAALREIRKIEQKSGRPPLPIIAVTANVMAHQVAEYLSSGFDLCLAKPLDSGELAFGIRSLLAERARA